MTTGVQPASEIRATDQDRRQRGELRRTTCPKTVRPRGPIDAAVSKHRAAGVGSACSAVALNAQIQSRLLGKKQVNASNVNRSFGSCGSDMDIAETRAL